MLMEAAWNQELRTQLKSAGLGGLRELGCKGSQGVMPKGLPALLPANIASDESKGFSLLALLCQSPAVQTVIREIRNHVGYRGD